MKNLGPMIEELLSTTNVPDRWEQALDCFTDTMGIDAACLFSVHEFDEFSMNFVWSRYNRQKLSKDFLELMERGGDDDDRQGYEFIMSNPAQRFYDEFEMFGCENSANFPKSHIRDVARSVGLKMRHAAVINQRGPWVDGLFCQTKTEIRSFELLDSDLVSVIMPIFSHAITLGRTLSALRARFGEALKALDHLGIGVVLVKKGGAVLDANKEANRIFSLSDGLTLSNEKKLNFASADVGAEYQAQINSAFASLSGDARAGSPLMACKRKSLEHDFLISIRPLLDANDELDRDLECAFVTIIDPNRSSALSSKGISALGKLTETETEVVDMLLQGLRLSEVSARRNVSLNTTKTHLKRISDKLRCGSQSDIIRVAAATSLPIE